LVVYNDPTNGNEKMAVVKAIEKDWAGIKPYIVLVPNGHV